MELVTTKICKTSDIGVNDNLFGGTMLAWIDEAGAIYAAKEVNDKNVVTLKMDEVIFKKPVKVKDFIEIYGSVLKTGKTSITLEISAWRLDVEKDFSDPTKSELVCSTRMIFVRIDPETKKPKNIE